MKSISPTDGEALLLSWEGLLDQVLDALRMRPNALCTTFELPSQKASEPFHRIRSNNSIEDSSLHCGELAASLDLASPALTCEDALILYLPTLGESDLAFPLHPSLVSQAPTGGGPSVYDVFYRLPPRRPPNSHSPNWGFQEVRVNALGRSLFIKL